MWACALGHLEAALLLYGWNSHALSIPDSLGRLPLTVARSRGHVKLATCLEELQRQEGPPPEPPGAEPGVDPSEGPGKAWGGQPRAADSLHIPSPLSASPDTGLSTISSISSPSELSEGSVSITSAYSSGSALRESPAYSPDAEGAMDVCQLPRAGSTAGWYLQETPSPPGLSHTPFFMGCEVGAMPCRGAEPELLGFGENVENDEYLPAPEVLQVIGGPDQKQYC
uniref:Uncharacterized protein n=1 Tax=Sphenodon punctatus TaxID=8508 RepID=A0A8D0H433_SPHPU